MKLTASVKLLVTPEQSIALLQTLEKANVVGDLLSLWAWDNQAFGQYAIHNGDWFLLATCNVDEPPQAVIEGVLGVDLGITEVAVDSDGHAYSGEAIKSVRVRTKRLRTGLQRCGSPSAKRHLRKARRKQSRFTTWANHNISKQLVQTAFKSAKAIALEDLTGIRARASASKQMRWLLGNWAFDQLRQFVEYKAKRVGVPILIVDPCYSSQTCSQCGHCERANRVSQSQFHCQKCGFQANADFNAALNLRARGELVSRPMVSDLIENQIQSPCL